MKQPFQPYGAIRAFDLATGERRWEFRTDAGLHQSGVLTTASDLLFTGVRGGNPGGDVPLAYVAVAAGRTLWSFTLRD